MMMWRWVPASGLAESIGGAPCGFGEKSFGQPRPIGGSGGERCVVEAVTRAVQRLAVPRAQEQESARPLFQQIGKILAGGARRQILDHTVRPEQIERDIARETRLGDMGEDAGGAK